jgi:hypothetical protein
MFTMKNPELSQSVENKNRLLKYARNAAAVGALATVAVQPKLRKFHKLQLQQQRLVQHQIQLQLPSPLLK